jgi:hypothetical protein
MRLALACCLAAVSLSGCAVYNVASTAVDVTTTAVGTAVDVTSAVVTAPFGHDDTDKKKDD